MQGCSLFEDCSASICVPATFNWKLQIGRNSTTMKSIVYLDELLFFFNRKDIWHETAVQERVNVLEESCIIQLVVEDYKDDVATLATGRSQHSFHVFSPFVDT